MKKHSWKKKLTIVTMLLSLGAGPVQTIKAETVDEVKTRLQSCDDALTACKAVYLEQKDLLQKQDDLIVKITKQRNELIEGQSASSTPFYFWLVIGLAGGVVLTRGIR